MGSDHNKRISVGFTAAGICLIIIAAAGLWGQTQHLWTSATYVPWGIVMVIGILLFFSRGAVMRLVSSIELLGAKIEFQQQETNKHHTLINENGERLAALEKQFQNQEQTQGQQQTQLTRQGQQAVGGLNFNIANIQDPQAFREILEAILQAHNAQGSQTPFKASVEANEETPSPAGEMYKPSYVTRREKQHP